METSDEKHRRQRNQDHAEIAVDTGMQEMDTAPLKHRDYAGAVAKTDPKEIALVRKLDYRIMVSSILCYSVKCIIGKEDIVTDRKGSPLYLRCTF